MLKQPDQAEEHLGPLESIKRIVSAASAAVVGGPSGPMLLFQIAASGAKSVGPEGPPTKNLQRLHRQPRWRSAWMRCASGRINAGLLEAIKHIVSAASAAVVGGPSGPTLFFPDRRELSGKHRA